jgi:hypothetical protein
LLALKIRETTAAEMCVVLRFRRTVFGAKICRVLLVDYESSWFNAPQSVYFGSESKKVGLQRLNSTSASR